MLLIEAKNHPRSIWSPTGSCSSGGEVRARFEIGGGSFVLAPDHWHGLRFAEEHTRGYDAEEECFTPGYVDAVADEQGRVDVAINVLPQVPQYDVPSVADSDIPLAQAAADFLVARGHPQGPSVIAGWPWFADWGRDTLLSIPGLLLVDGRTDEAEAMLETWGATVSEVGFPIASWMKTRGGISVRRMQPFGICTWLVFGSKLRSTVCPRPHRHGLPIDRGSLA